MKQNKTEMNPVIQDDILRYKKNKFAANFALLALVFNCLYFMLFYSVNSSQYYTYLLGLSVIVNLLVLLLGFFCSEGIKGYNGKFAYVLFALAAAQIIRIFIFPLMGISKNWLTGNYYFGVAMTSPVQGTILIIYLAASAACFIVSGVQGLITANRLKAFQKKLDSGDLSIEDTLKELDEADAKAAESCDIQNNSEELNTVETGEAAQTDVKELNEGNEVAPSDKEEDNG